MFQLSPLLEEIQAPPHPIDIIRDLLDEVGSLPRLMEIHYLLQEPVLLDIMRRLGSLAEDDRRRLREYLARCGEARLGVRELPAGTLILECAHETPFDQGA